MNRDKLYTKKGDDGTTGLLSGKRVNKHHIRIKAYGTVDELNAEIGLCRELIIRTENKSLCFKDLNLTSPNIDSCK